MPGRHYYQQCSEDSNWQTRCRSLVVTSASSLSLTILYRIPLLLCLRPISERRGCVFYQEHSIFWFSLPHLSLVFNPSPVLIPFWYGKDRDIFFLRIQALKHCDIPKVSWILYSIFIPYQGLFAPGAIPPMTVFNFLLCVHGMQGDCSESFICVM